MAFNIFAYDFKVKYATSTAAPAGGQIYYQILAVPLTLIEFATVFMFEHLHKLNTARLRECGLSLTERYQLFENIRTLDLLRPIARFHGIITCLTFIIFLLLGPSMIGTPSYPFFEESINAFQLQAILMPLVIIRNKR
ncbi:hypothetical protein PMAYCL1PPCAC_04791, partial [Pristionchus mayeri]